MMVLLAMIGLTLTYALVHRRLRPAGLGSGLQRLSRPRPAGRRPRRAWPRDIRLTANQIVAAVVSLGLFRHPVVDRLAGLAAAGADRELVSRPLAARALHALRVGRDVYVGFRLLPCPYPAWPVPDRSRAGAPLSDGRASDRAATAALGGGLAGWPSGAVLGGAAPAAADAARAMAELALHRRRGRRRVRAVRARQCGAHAARRSHRPHAREDLHAVGGGDGGGGRARPRGARHVFLPLAGSRRAARPRHPGADGAAQSAVPAHRGRSRQGARRWRAPTASASTTPR